jgi:predicted Zn-dependent protease
MRAWMLAIATAGSVIAGGCTGDPTAGPLRDEATLYGRALTASQAGDHATAIDHLDALVATADRPEYRLARGLEHLRSGDAARARTDAEAGLGLDPDEAARKDLQWLAAEAAKLAAGGQPPRDPAPPSWHK